MNPEAKPVDGFLRDRQTIARRLAAANSDVSDDPTEPRSDQTWETISAMAWRPAWSIRSRRGSLRTLIDWWRERRARRPGQ